MRSCFITSTGETLANFYDGVSLIINSTGKEFEILSPKGQRSFHSVSLAPSKLQQYLSKTFRIRNSLAPSPVCPSCIFGKEGNIILDHQLSNAIFRPADVRGNSMQSADKFTSLTTKSHGKLAKITFPAVVSTSVQPSHSGGAKRSFVYTQVSQLVFPGEKSNPWEEALKWLKVPEGTLTVKLPKAKSKKYDCIPSSLLEQQFPCFHANPLHPPASIQIRYAYIREDSMQAFISVNKKITTVLPDASILVSRGEVCTWIRENSSPVDFIHGLEPNILRLSGDVAYNARSLFKLIHHFSRRPGRLPEAVQVRQRKMPKKVHLWLDECIPGVGFARGLNSGDLTISFLDGAMGTIEGNSITIITSTGQRLSAPLEKTESLRGSSNQYLQALLFYHKLNQMPPEHRDTFRREQMEKIATLQSISHTIKKRLRSTF